MKRVKTLQLGFIGLFVVSFAFVTCQEAAKVGENGDGPENGAPPADPAAEGLVPLTLGKNEIWVEVADGPETRSRGLMHRDALARDRGMVFLYPRERILTFWMRNTRIPLSIAYIQSNGRIAQIRDMEPYDETNLKSSVPCLYALEMNQGWFERAGVVAGDRVVGLSSLPPAKE